MNQSKKTKNIQCMECGKAMTVGLYEPKKQHCTDCRVAEPEEIVETAAIVSASSEGTREIVRREIAEFDQAQFSDNSYGTTVRRTMAALGYRPRPSGPGSVEYHKDYGDPNGMRTRVTVLFSRGQYGIGVDQGKLDGFCITEQIYIPATKTSISELSAAICIDDIESIQGALGVNVEIPETTTFDIKPCEACGVMTDEIFTNSKTNTGLCKECFTNSIEPELEPAPSPSP